MIGDTTAARVMGSGEMVTKLVGRLFVGGTYHGIYREVREDLTHIHMPFRRLEYWPEHQGERPSFAESIQTYRLVKVVLNYKSKGQHNRIVQEVFVLEELDPVEVLQRFVEERYGYPISRVEVS